MSERYFISATLRGAGFYDFPVHAFFIFPQLHFPPYFTSICLPSSRRPVIGYELLYSGRMLTPSTHGISHMFRMFRQPHRLNDHAVIGCPAIHTVLKDVAPSTQFSRMLRHPHSFQGCCAIHSVFNDVASHPHSFQGCCKPSTQLSRMIRPPHKVPSDTISGRSAFYIRRTATHFQDWSGSFFLYFGLSPY